MKKLIRKWLGINEDFSALSSAILKVNARVDNALLMKEGEIGHGTVQEYVYAIMHHLGLISYIEITHESPATTEITETRRTVVDKVKNVKSRFVVKELDKE